MNFGWNPMYMMNGPSDQFYSRQMCLWLKEDRKEMVVWRCDDDVSTKWLLDHSKSMRGFSWTVLTTAILWARFSLNGPTPASQFQSEVSFDTRECSFLCITRECVEPKRFKGERIMEWSSIKSRSETDWKCMVKLEDEIVWRWQTI